MKSTRISLFIINLAVILAMTAAVSATQVILEATGDPYLDTENLQEALDTHMAGDTLHLKGHFRLGAMLGAYGFDGVIKGDGMDETFIEVTGYPAKPGSGAPGPVYVRDPYGLVFCFEQVPGVELILKDLTVFYAGGVYGEDWNPLKLYAFVESYHGKDASVTYKNVRVATMDPLVERGLVSLHNFPVDGVYYPFSGSTSMVNCEAYGMPRGLYCGAIDGGSCSIVGSICQGNSIRGIDTWNIINSNLEILDNKLIGVGEGIQVFRASGKSDINNNLIGNFSSKGIYINKVSGGKANIKNNALYGGGKRAIEIVKSAEVQVKDNRSEGFSAAKKSMPVVRITESHDCTIANNTIADSAGSRRVVIETGTCQNNTYIGNRFINTQMYNTAIQIDGDTAILRNNDFTQSGIPGGGPVCIFLTDLSSSSYVNQPISLLPWGNQNPVEQIVDIGVGNVIVTTP